VRELEQEVGSTDEMPLSDLIANNDSTNDAYMRCLEEFRHSSVGVIALGAPGGAVGEFQSTSEHPISLGQTTHAGGRAMILAFADPPAFARRFGREFNAEIAGESLLETVFINPPLHGVLVNSAKEKRSLVIDRRTVEFLLTHAPPG